MTPNESKLREILCDILEIEPGDLTDDGSFIDDYDADSLRSVEILAALEKEFGVAISEKELPNMNTAGQVKHVLSQYGWKA
ncbi:MAG: polyketide-8 synthase acyl carrier protein [Sphingomonas sp.]|nr:MAG: polyketide-8 synthase acyl carrier protein [Sphingomonas sp.]